MRKLFFCIGLLFFNSACGPSYKSVKASAPSPNHDAVLDYGTIIMEGSLIVLSCKPIMKTFYMDAQANMTMTLAPGCLMESIDRKPAAPRIKISDGTYTVICPSPNIDADSDLNSIISFKDPCFL